MEKQIYEKPQAWVFELEAEGVFCVSNDGTEQFQNGNNYDDSFFD